VITPALTFSSDVAAIYQVGSTPVFLDVGLSEVTVANTTLVLLVFSNLGRIASPHTVGQTIVG